MDLLLSFLEPNCPHCALSARYFNKNAPLNDVIAKNLERIEVVCFLKDYGRSYNGKFQRTFLAVRIYAKENVASNDTQSSLKLLPDASESASQACASHVNETEKQMFSPNIKGVVDQMETKVGLDQENLLPVGVVKRGITFYETPAEEESGSVGAIVPTAADKTDKTAAGSASPVEKLKNVGSHK